MFGSEPGAKWVFNFRTILLGQRFDDFWRDRANHYAARNDVLGLASQAQCNKSVAPPPLLTLGLRRLLALGSAAKLPLPIPGKIFSDTKSVVGDSNTWGKVI